MDTFGQPPKQRVNGKRPQRASTDAVGSTSSNPPCIAPSLLKTQPTGVPTRPPIGDISVAPGVTDFSQLDYSFLSYETNAFNLPSGLPSFDDGEQASPSALMASFDMTTASVEGQSLAAALQQMAASDTVTATGSAPAPNKRHRSVESSLQMNGPSTEMPTLPATSSFPLPPPTKKLKPNASLQEPAGTPSASLSSSRASHFPQPSAPTSSVSEQVKGISAALYNLYQTTSTLLPAMAVETTQSTKLLNSVRRERNEYRQQLQAAQAECSQLRAERDKMKTTVDEQRAELIALTQAASGPAAEPSALRGAGQWDRLRNGLKGRMDGEDIEEMDDGEVIGWLLSKFGAGEIGTNSEGEEPSFGHV